MVQSKYGKKSIDPDELFSLSMSNKIDSDLIKNLEKEIETYKSRLDERDNHVLKVEKKNQ